MPAFGPRVIVLMWRVCIVPVLIALSSSCGRPFLILRFSHFHSPFAVDGGRRVPTPSLATQPFFAQQLCDLSFFTACQRPACSVSSQEPIANSHMHHLATARHVASVCVKCVCLFRCRHQVGLAPITCEVLLGPSTQPIHVWLGLSRPPAGMAAAGQVCMVSYS